jgi:pimeloyl-ACP methyl ester carboxylesterase
MKFELVRTITKDDLHLSGLLYESNNVKTLCIYIHGYMSDFYSWPFAEKIAEDIKNSGKKDVSILLAQHRGTGMHTEILSQGFMSASLIGSDYELIEESHLDISAWIAFASERGYSEIILMGHSLGTHKVVRYLFEGEFSHLVTKLILLAPFDKNGYLEEKTKGEWRKHLIEAREKISNGNELEMITEKFDDYPMTYRTYYSWYKEDDYNCVWDFYRKANYSFPIMNQINIPVKIIVGTADDFFYIKSLNTLEEVTSILKSSIKNLDLYLVDGASHCYVGYEGEVAKEVVKFF